LNCGIDPLNIDCWPFIKAGASIPMKCRFEEFAALVMTDEPKLIGRDGIQMGYDDSISLRSEFQDIKGPRALETRYHTNVSVLEWYLMYAAESKPVLIQETIDAVTLSCIKQFTTESSWDTLVKKCPTVVKLSEYIVSKEHRIPRELNSLPRRSVTEFNSSPYGFHRFIKVLSGRIETIMCDIDTATSLLYPTLSVNGVNYQASAFAPNYASYPESKLISQQCFSKHVRPGEQLFIPHNYVVSYQAKSTTMVLIDRFVDSLNRNIFLEKYRTHSLVTDISSRDINDLYSIAQQRFISLQTVLYQLPKTTFNDWQLWTRVNMLKTQIDQVDFSGLVLLLSLKRSKATFRFQEAAAVQVQWRVTSGGPIHSLVIRYHDSFTLHGLLPNTEYAIRARPLSRPHNIPGRYSAKWLTFKSAAEAPPEAPVVSVSLASRSVELSWKAPEDDGGFEISKYEVYALLPHHAKSFLMTTLSARARNATLRNLKPGVEYRFQVAAVNEVGTGDTSKPSDPVKLTSSMKQLVDSHMKHFVTDPDIHVRYENFKNDPRYYRIFGKQSGPMITLSDSLELLLVHNDYDTMVDSIHSWSAHYSPKMFDVTANGIRAKPFQACTIISSIIKDRIVFIERGGCPILTKVQMAFEANAIGVVIVDNGAFCDKAYDHNCSPGASKTLKDGFSKHDSKALWDQYYLPVVIVGKSKVANLLSSIPF